MVSVVCRYPGTVSTLVAKRRGYTRRKTEPLQYLRYRRKEQSFCDTVQKDLRRPKHEVQTCFSIAAPTSKSYGGVNPNLPPNSFARTLK